MPADPVPERKSRPLPLLETPVLIVDLQAANARPATGTLLEAGWACYRAADPPESLQVTCTRMALPAGASISPAVLRVTGLTLADFEDGIGEPELWACLERESTRAELCVAHFARYEEGFLRRLHADHGIGAHFPLEVVCTHRLARRLFPDLPRFGLRAVAGYLGHSVPERRRSGHHVEATAWIWSRIVSELAARGVGTFPALRAWLEAVPEAPREPVRIPLARPPLRRLPDRPGNYAFFRSNGDILYVGKARSLRKRIPSYFRRRGQAEHILEMITQARELRTRVSFTALEAALVECGLIQTLHPPYNRALRVNSQPVLFSSRDLKCMAEAPDAQCTLGPLTDRGTFLLMAELVRLFSESPAVDGTDGWVVPGPGAGLAALLPPYLAEAGTDETLREALRQLAEQAGIVAGRERPEVIRRLTRYGRALLREARVRRGARVEETETEEGFEAEDSAAPAPELPVEQQLARWLSGSCAGWTRMLIRARSYPRLESAVVRWRRGSGRWKVAVFKQGRTVFSGFQEPEEPLPQVLMAKAAGGPAGLDRSACTRVRVLVTELRRLLAEGADIQVGLPGGSLLAGRRLEVWLQWQ